MISFTVVSLAVSMLLVVFGVTVLLSALCFLEHARRIKQKAINMAKLVDKRTQNKVNRVISLSANEFENYLFRVYSSMLEVVSAKDVSDKDPNAITILYAKSLEAMITYLGSETVEAIDYYYGKDYLFRWCELRFKLLENRGTLPNIIAKRASADSIENETLS